MRLLRVDSRNNPSIALARRARLIYLMPLSYDG